VDTRCLFETLATIVRLLCILALLVPLAVAQEARMIPRGRPPEPGNYGSLAAVKNLRVKVDSGSVTLRGGQQDGINYQVRTRTRTLSEQDAKRQFEAYKVSAWSGRYCLDRKPIGRVSLATFFW